MGKNYFIKLKPLNTFYFGSIKGFDKENTEYFLKSNCYPQQTAVLGMLRKKILEDNNCLVPYTSRTAEHINKEKEYIGEIKADMEDSSFGKIKKISSIQIYKGSTPYIFSYSKMDFSGNEVLTSKGKKILPEYDAKTFDGKPRKTANDSEEILQESIDIGIKKLSKEDAAFFKKQRYSFINKDFYFGFYVSLSEDVKLSNGIVQLGDKYSIFSFQIKECETDELDISKVFNQDDAVFFMSDAYIYQEDLERIIELSRGMLFQNNKFKFISREERKYKPQESIKNLIGRGSILLVDEQEEILKILKDEKYKNYKKIGLNNYKFKGGNI